MNGPKCRLCQREHWLSVNCAGEPHAGVKNTQREGRRVLKGSTGKASPAKPTRSASTEKVDPTTPAKAPADKATAEKAGLGNPKPRTTKKKGRKKK